MWPWGGGAPEVDIGDNVQNSLMLDSTASQGLSRTPTVNQAGSTAETVSVWRKLGKLGTYRTIFEGYVGAGNYTRLILLTNDTLQYEQYVSGSAVILKVSNRVFRDPNAFFNFVVKYDSTQAVQADRIKIYANNEELTSFSTNVCNTALNASDSYFCYSTSCGNTIGYDPINGFYDDGYYSNFILVKGQGLTPDNFGRTSADTGAWVNKNYTGTYGANGFKLEFKNGAALGTDTSGNGNNWTLNGGITSANQTTDTPTNNYCVLSPIDMRPTVSTPVLSKGNLTATVTSNVYSTARASLARSSGKWYWEYIQNSDTNGNLCCGIADVSSKLDTYCGYYPVDYGFNANFNFTYNNHIAAAYGTGGSSNDSTLMCAFDADNGKLYFGRNGVWYASADPVAGTNAAFTGITGTKAPAYSHNAGGAQTSSASFNFGQRAFTYTPPTGFKALCTANLPTPSIIKPAKYFKAQKRTGTGAAFNVSGIEFSPNLVWVKSRSAIRDHRLVDTLRGATIEGYSNTGTAEATDVQGVTAFNADGFSGGTSSGYNAASELIIDWMWKKSIASGFDIALYTGTGVAKTVPHSLGVKPELIIVFDRTTGRSRRVYSSFLGATKVMYLDSTLAALVDNTSWNATEPTSSVFTVGTDVGTNTNLDNYVAYLFASVEGFSKVGNYNGNNLADGPFIYCGFRPAFIIIKRYESAGDWVMIDAQRDPYNVSGHRLYANVGNAEDLGDANLLDITSNGFKFRSNVSGLTNGLGNYIFIAFAEMPIKYSNAR